MSYNPSQEFLIEVAKGNIAGHSLVNKFGFNDAVGATLQPIADGAVYQTPTTAQSLEIVSSSANDTSAGTGARSVEIQGLDASFVSQTVTVATNGTSAVAVTGTWTRVFRVMVKDSGTYATQAAGSHAGTITLRNSGAGVTWATIVLTASSFAAGQTEIGAYTVPAGYTGYLLSKHVSIESTKIPNILWFRRENADDVAAPYDSMRLFERHNGSTAEITYQPPAPTIVLPAKTDIGAMGYVATGSAAVSIEFQILLVAD